MNISVVCATLYVGGVGAVGIVPLGVFEHDTDLNNLDIAIETDVPIFGCCATINDVKDEPDTQTVLIDFGKDIETAASKIVGCLVNKLGFRCVADCGAIVE